MPRDQKPAEEFNDMAEQTKAQALAAADQYFNFLKKTISSYPSGGTEFGDNLKGYAEKNIAAVHEFVQKLSQPGFRRVSTSDRIHAVSFSAFREQTRSLGEAYTKSAEAFSKPRSFPD